METEKIKKLYLVYDEVQTKVIEEHINNLKNTNTNSSETMMFIESAYKSIDETMRLIDNNDFIDGLSVLRCAFETILFAIAMNLDEEIKKAYQNYNYKLYRILQKKNKKQNNHSKSKENLTRLTEPRNIRKVVSINHEKVFGKLFIDSSADEVEKELRSFYNYLCDITHPSIIKTFLYNIQKDDGDLTDVKSILKININFCKILLLLNLTYLTSQNKNETIYDLYIILIFLNLCTVSNAEKVAKTLKKYDDFLYMENNSKIFEQRKKEINELEKDFKSIDEKKIENILPKKMENILIEFDCMDIFEKYFNQKLNQD